MVAIDHGDGVLTSYMHNTSVVVKPEQANMAGQVVAISGSSGLGSGANIHFQINVVDRKERQGPLISSNPIQMHMNKNKPSNSLKARIDRLSFLAFALCVAISISCQREQELAEMKPPEAKVGEFSKEAAKQIEGLYGHWEHFEGRETIADRSLYFTEEKGRYIVGFEAGPNGFEETIREFRCDDELCSITYEYRNPVLKESQFTFTIRKVSDREIQVVTRPEMLDFVMQSGDRLRLRLRQ